MVDATYKGTKISIEPIQTEDGNWAGRATLKHPDGETEELAPRIGFETRQLAKDAALEDARGYIDRRK